jgi:hypothetical protein
MKGGSVGHCGAESSCPPGRASVVAAFIHRFAAHLLHYILIPGAVEILLALWLFAMGVNVQRWKEQASTAAERQ